MIVIIDPLITGFSHEMVNAGFVYSISKDNKDNKILFIAEEKHIECIKDIFCKYCYEPSNIKYIICNNIFDYVIINIKLFQYSKKKLIKKFIFLSYDALVISLIYKFIKHTPVYLVSHAILESIIDNENKRENILKTKKEILNKIYTSSFLVLVKLLKQYSKNIFQKYLNKIIDKFFNFKTIFLNETRDNVTYILLSEHIKRNFSKLKILHNNKIKVVPMPYMFPKNRPITMSKQLNNFGVIGYGNPKVMKNIIEKINNLSLLNKYTFWNIGANSSGLHNLDNLVFPISNRFLSRKEISKFSNKLDFSLILYDKKSYTLSTSASILESILYLKPIIYLDNSCINEFNKANIGIRCESVEELIETIVDIIKNPKKYKEEYEIYFNNIVELRNNLDLDNRKNIVV